MNMEAPPLTTRNQTASDPLKNRHTEYFPETEAGHLFHIFFQNPEILPIIPTLEWKNVSAEFEETGCQESS